VSKKEYRMRSKSEVYIPTFKVKQSGKIDIPVNSDLGGYPSSSTRTQLGLPL